MNAMLPGFCAGMWTTPGRARKCAAAPATTMCMHSSRHRASPEHARSVVCAYPRSASNCPPHPRWPAAPFVASTFLTARTQRPYQPHTRARSCEPSPASRNGHARVWSPLHALSVRRGTRHLAAPWFRTHHDECATRSRRVACNSSARNSRYQARIFEAWIGSFTQDRLAQACFGCLAA